jgi:L-ascorbate metabolism protein UlaG (beta-lactamase superfamily)
MTWVQEVQIRPLGQVGYRFIFGNQTIYIDPYLSNSVQQLEDSDMERLVPVPVNAADVNDADYVFITHVHRDHCDEETVLAIARASNCRIVGPEPVCDKLKEIGVKDERIIQAGVSPLVLDDGLVVYPVPSAHPEIVVQGGGGWFAIGYIFEYNGYRLYHAGDTSLRDEIIDAINAVGRIDKAFLPVNEKNFYKDKRGIIGNMSIREAFYLAEAIDASTLVPTHWDMFAINQVFPEEIQLVYDKLKPAFNLEILPCN